MPGCAQPVTAQKITAELKEGSGDDPIISGGDKCIAAAATVMVVLVVVVMI